MRWSVLFLCLLFPLCHAHQLYAPLSIIPKYTLPTRLGFSTFNYHDSYPAGAFIKTTLFCTEDRKINGTCDYFQNTPEETTLLDATVAVGRASRGRPAASCAGTVIEIKKEGKSCRKPLLLTSAHCVNFLDVTGKREVGAFNHLGGAFITPQEIQDLQGRCLDTANKNCLVTPETMINASNLGYTGVDQALVPLTNFNEEYAIGTISGYEVDIDQVATKDDLEGCFDGTREAIITTSLGEYHLSSKGGPIRGRVPNNTRDLIRKDTCKNLSWEKGRTKDYINHDCPALVGLSGSLLTLSCNNKKGLFVHQTQRFGARVSQREIDKATAGESMPFDPYRSFVNTAVHITPELLELFSDNYCGFGM